MPPANPAGRPGATSGYVPVNGLEMYYEIHGDGSPLALFHGAMGTIDSCLADLVGYSMGGAVAVELAMQHPGMVRRIVFAGGTSYRRDGLYPEMLAEPESAADDLTDSAWHKAYQRVAPDPGRWPVLVAKNGELDRTFAGWTDEDIQAMTTPMLLIIGDSDIVRPEHTMKMFRLLGGGVIGDLAGLPASQLAVLPGTSHVGLLDRVDWLQSMILGFLGTPVPRPL